MMQSVGKHQEVPKEDALVKPVKERKWHRARKLVAGRPGEPKELTRGYCGSRKERPLPAEQMCPAMQVRNDEKEFL
jgi:hypothetical protein